MKLPDLLLEIESVADMNHERALAVGRAYDAEPELRPRRVGGDPARIKVETTLEDLIRRTDLPIRWLTVRVNTREEFEGGELKLWRGRGGYIAWPREDGTKEFSLVPHEVTHDVLRSWADAESGRIDRVAALFTRLCDALDACYGATSLLPRTRSLPPVDVGLAQIGWLNCFGPAFVDRFPRLLDTGHPSTRTSNGGVVIRVADAPWDIRDEERRPVVEALGHAAILSQWDAGTPRGVHVPSYEDHMRFSPGTTEMPWVAGEAERERARAERSRERRHATARKRRLAAMDGFESPTVIPAAEWSTSFDADDWRSFGPPLFRRLGGDLAGRFGKALVEEIASAPPNHEESVALGTAEGPVEVRWFIDDVDTIDLFLFGASTLPALVDAEHERWAEG